VNLKGGTVIDSFSVYLRIMWKEILKKKLSQCGIDFLENSFSIESFKLNIPTTFI